MLKQCRTSGARSAQLLACMSSYKWLRRPAALHTPCNFLGTMQYEGNSMPSGIWACWKKAHGKHAAGHLVLI